MGVKGKRGAQKRKKQSTYQPLTGCLAVMSQGSGQPPVYFLTMCSNFFYLRCPTHGMTPLSKSQEVVQGPWLSCPKGISSNMQSYCFLPRQAAGSSAQHLSGTAPLSQSCFLPSMMLLPNQPSELLTLAYHLLPTARVYFE